ncbi:nSTAND1 domain-containing NTPase [Nocardiopsis lucentensis]|uniref:nSTAND1 domain-containing NTPase n=1 Tax=Nocardiopsis lucentensis TaxID=53441 RepID=UPI000594E92B|nr:trypsin-like peptidase domain-containing protein [Nocardiopsis lucentensis]
MTGTTSRSAQEALASAVVRISSPDGAVCGAGALVASDLVLTCAHVVSDALGRPRGDEVALGAVVTVDLPLAGQSAGGGARWPAEVVQWVPIRSDRTGDVALLRLGNTIPGAHPLPVADPEDVWEHGARSVGFVDGEPTALWLRGRLGGVTEEGWIQLSRADGQTAFAKRGFSGSPVWDNELGAVVGLVVAAQPEQDSQQVFVLRTRTLLHEITGLDAVLFPDPPFRGLSPLREGDADIFFGRDDDVDKVVAALRGDHAAVTVYGPSGCGKSSLALAGVVPRMRQDGFEVLVVNAGRVGSLRAALATELFEAMNSGRFGPARAERTDQGQLERWLDDLGLMDAFHRATGRQDMRLLIVLDQFEALLNLSEPEIEQVVALLFPERGPEGLRVLATLRADLMDAMLSHARLGPALKRGSTLPITPMTRDQLHAVITQPLRRVPAVEYDPGLDLRILDDAGDEPGTLPLLSFVLEQLWEERVAGRLRASAYEQLGGVSGALRKHADEAWRACVRPEDEAEARQLLTGLVRVLPGGEAPQRRVLTWREAGDTRWRLVQALAQWRLLVLYGGDGQPESAELAHEALILAWPRLADEVRRSADFLAGRAEVQHDLERWRRANSRSDMLPGALQLASLEARLRGRETDLTAEQQDFLARARRRRRVRRARARTAGVAAALALALIVGLSTFLVQQSNVSQQRAAESLSRALAVRSDELMETDPGLAALTALAAYEAEPTQEALSALMRRYDAFQEAVWTLTGPQGEISAVAMSADGLVTLVTTEGGRATLFVRTPEGEVEREHLNLAQNVLSPVVSRDGGRIAYRYDLDGTLVWHDVTPSGEQMVGPPQRLHPPLTSASLGTWFFDTKIVDFSPDGRRLVGVSAADSGLPVRVWDLESGRSRTLSDDVFGLVEVWFGPDENTLVAVRSDDDPESLEHSVVVVDIRAGTTRELVSGVLDPDISVSGDGAVVVVCGEEVGTGTPEQVGYRALSVSDGRVLRDFAGRVDASCADVAVTEGGERFAVLTAQDEWDLVDTSDWQASPARFLAAPPSYLSVAKGAPLLGTEREPVVVTQNDDAVTGWLLTEYFEYRVESPPRLLGDGSTLVSRAVREGADDDLLVVMDTEGSWETLAEVQTGASIPPDPAQEIQVNSSGTLVADVSNLNRITVRELPSLRPVTEFDAVLPSVGEDGARGLLEYLFLNDDQIVTVSDTLVEHWDARDGRRLSQPVDVADLRLTTEEHPAFLVARHPEPGHVAVTVHGEPDVHAVDLATGGVDEDLRVRLGDGLVAVAFLKDPRYAAAMTTGLMVELWSIPSDREPERVVGPLGPLVENRWTVGRAGAAGFFLANGSSVQFLRADEPYDREVFEFGGPQGFLAAADDGRALLRAPDQGGGMEVFRLDPGLWRRHLCAVVGRDFTDDERDGLPPGLPPGLPTETCPREE